jgi:hypothetical protein
MKAQVIRRDELTNEQKTLHKGRIEGIDGSTTNKRRIGR